MRYDYQVVPLSLDNGLYNHAVSSGKNYIMLLSAPPTANVRIRLGSKEADEIPLKENFAVRCSPVNEIYVSADELPGEKIHLVISSEKSGVMIDPSPQINSLEEITKIENFGSPILEALDKIMQPYEHISTDVLYDSSGTSITLIDEVLNCDKVIIDLHCPYSANQTYYSSNVYIDGKPVRSAKTFLFPETWLQQANTSITLEGVRGKNLRGSVVRGSITIQKFNKKV